MKNSKAITIYIDGSSSGNPGPSGVGVLLEWNGIERRISKHIGIATNNIAELMAVKVALTSLTVNTHPVNIYTDSSYVHGILQLGWKAKTNGSLIARIKALMTNFADVRIFKVAGHAGIVGNETADELAKAASKAK